MIKIFKIFILLFFLISITFYYIFGFNNQCKNLKIFNSINDFGLRHIFPCFYLGDKLDRFKYAIKNSFFYNI